jgi:hypothetical protein
MIKKIICSALIVASIITVIPVGVSAEWRHDNTGWWYTEGNSYSIGWTQINDSWYYFGTNGYMKTGWIQDKAWWYYLQDNGSMATGKVVIKDKTYEFASNGKWINNALPNKNESNSVSKPPSAEKMNATRDFSWFNEDGNTYFKVEDDVYIKGGWNIDGNVYIFDKNGVLQKGEYTSASGRKYSLGDDGKVIKCISDESYQLCPQYAITTKSSTDNFDVKLDDNHMMDITSVDLDDSEKNKVQVKAKTLYCKANQIVDLGTIKVNGMNSNSSLFPNLVVISDSTDSNIADSGISLSLEDGFFRNIHPTIIAYKPGKTTVTIYVNGEETSFDVVVTQ